VTPAEEFAALLEEPPIAAIPELPQTTPRLPAPNASQGASGRCEPPRPDPATAFGELLRSELHWAPR